MSEIVGASYIKVVGSGAIYPEYETPVVLTCKDQNGNTIKDNVVIVNSSTGSVDIYLPTIDQLADDLNTSIRVIIEDNTLGISLIGGGDKIGQNFLLTIPPATYTSGVVLTLTPAYNGFWTLNETIN